MKSDGSTILEVDKSCLEQLEKVMKEKEDLQNEMETTVLRLTKELNKRQEKKEKPEKALKIKTDECHKLDTQIEQMQLDLDETRHNK